MTHLSWGAPENLQEDCLAGSYFNPNWKVYCKKDDHMFVSCNRNPYLNQVWVKDWGPNILEEHPSTWPTRPRCEMASIDEVYLDLTEEAGWLWQVSHLMLDYCELQMEKLETWTYDGTIIYKIPERPCCLFWNPVVQSWYVICLQMWQLPLWWGTPVHGSPWPGFLSGDSNHH